MYILSVVFWSFTQVSSGCPGLARYAMKCMPKLHPARPTMQWNACQSSTRPGPPCDGVHIEASPGPALQCNKVPEKICKLSSCTNFWNKEDNRKKNVICKFIFLVINLPLKNYFHNFYSNYRSAKTLSEIITMLEYNFRNSSHQ
jgi:hypothetical protein